MGNSSYKGGKDKGTYSKRLSNLQKDVKLCLQYHQAHADYNARFRQASEVFCQLINYRRRQCYNVLRTAEQLREFIDEKYKCRDNCTTCKQNPKWKEQVKVIQQGGTILIPPVCMIAVTVEAMQKAMNEIFVKQKKSQINKHDFKKLVVKNLEVARKDALPSLKDLTKVEEILGDAKIASYNIQEKLKAQENFTEKIQPIADKVKKEIKSNKPDARRLAAMPPSDEPLAATDTGYLPSSEPSAVSVGLVTTVGLCAAFVLRRFYNCFTAKRRDSFGFEPDSRRASLNAAERMV